jgi:hypothetical protein
LHCLKPGEVMYWNSTARPGLILGGIALLALSLSGCSNQAPPTSTRYVPDTTAQNCTEPVARPPVTEPASSPSCAPQSVQSYTTSNARGAVYGAAPVVYGASPFGSNLTPAPPPEITESASAEQDDRYIERSRRDVERSRRVGSADRVDVRERHSRVYVKKRPLKHSLEIIGGSAAGGALIGGLAGGGKGAGIGALVGAGGGFVYDRLTRKKKVVVTE